MNVTLTLDFDNMSELQKFLDNRGSAAAPSTNHDVDVPPTVLEAVPPLVAAPATEVDPLSSPDPVEAETPEEFDAVMLREQLMAKLKTLAGDMDDPSVLGKFINSFGVARFSEIADEDLPAFSIALVNEFGA